MNDTQDLPVLEDAVAGPAAGTDSTPPTLDFDREDELKQALTDALMVRAQSIVETISRESASQLAERLTDELSAAMPEVLDEVLGKTLGGDAEPD